MIIVVLYLPLQYLGSRLFHLLSTCHTYPPISRVCFGACFFLGSWNSSHFILFGIGFTWHGPLVPILARKVRFDDVGRPFLLGMSRTPSYAKTPSIQKVHAFPFENSFRTPLDGILRKHLPLCIHRYDTTSTSTRGDANEVQDSIPSKVYAWKRRRKRQDARKKKKEGQEAQPRASLQASLEPSLGGRPTAQPSPLGRPSCARPRSEERRVGKEC